MDSLVCWRGLWLVRSEADADTQTETPRQNETGTQTHGETRRHTDTHADTATHTHTQYIYAYVYSAPDLPMPPARKREIDQCKANMSASNRCETGEEHQGQTKASKRGKQMENYRVK